MILDMLSRGIIEPSRNNTYQISHELCGRIVARTLVMDEQARLKQLRFNTRMAIFDSIWECYEREGGIEITEYVSALTDIVEDLIRDN